MKIDPSDMVSQLILAGLVGFCNTMRIRVVGHAVDAEDEAQYAAASARRWRALERHVVRIMHAAGRHIADPYLRVTAGLGEAPGDESVSPDFSGAGVERGAPRPAPAPPAATGPLN